MSNLKLIQNENILRNYLPDKLTEPRISSNQVLQTKVQIFCKVSNSKSLQICIQSSFGNKLAIFDRKLQFGNKIKSTHEFHELFVHFYTLQLFTSKLRTPIEPGFLKKRGLGHMALF